MNKRGFTLIEVLISVLILFVTASALFRFNIFIKNQFEQDIESHKLIMLSSAVLGEKKYTKDTKYYLDTLVKLGNIHDDDMRFLKDNYLYIESTEEIPYFLYSDGETDYEIEYGMHYIHNDKANEKLLWIEQ
ncbi:MAG: prepilin-type N-terminal cleavage/methylation domain-containing protein [Helicobacteraceae bacterium]|nr:prepilin-type N-terminal cleavage/methylation domain-containing protein [Helicobacteraceae bacterium]